MASSLSEEIFAIPHPFVEFPDDIVISKFAVKLPGNDAAEPLTAPSAANAQASASSILDPGLECIICWLMTLATFNSFTPAIAVLKLTTTAVPAFVSDN